MHSDAISPNGERPDSRKSRGNSRGTKKFRANERDL